MRSIPERETFIVHVLGLGRGVLVERSRTTERVLLDSVDELGAQLKRWLAVPPKAPAAHRLEERR